MSVLIDGVTIVIQKCELELRYPGGVAGFLRDAARDASAVWTCDGDERLVSIGVASEEAAAPLMVLLYIQELMPTTAEGAGDWVLVLGAAGPEHQCVWLETSACAGGHSRGWLTGTAPGRLAAPAGWRARRAARTAPAEPLDAGAADADDEGDEWMTDPQATADESPEYGAERDPARVSYEGLLATFEETEWIARPPRFPFIDIELPGHASNSYICVYSSLAGGQTVTCRANAPVAVPEPQRMAVAELIIRTNERLPCGSLQLDFESGRVHYRVSCDFEGERISPKLFTDIGWEGVAVLDHYFPQILAVAFGQRTVAEAMEMSFTDDA